MKKCDNCATCPVMSIDPKLRRIYDWSHNFPQFAECGNRFDGTQENILCFNSLFYKTINWKEVEKTYLRNKEKIDGFLKFDEPGTKSEQSGT